MGKELACNAEDVGNVGSHLGSFFLRSHMFVYILQFSIRNMEYFLKIIIWWVFFFFFGCLFVLQHIHKDDVF